MKLSFALPVTVAFAATLFAQCDGTVRSMSGNFSTDLYGPVDTRPSTWGVAEATTRVLTFNPPKGCRVEVRKVRGDLTAWPMGSVPPGSQAGVLIGIGKVPEGTVATNPNSSSALAARFRPANSKDRSASMYADWADDDTMLYLQGGTSGEVARIPFSEDLVNSRLNSNHQLIFTMADWLNTTGKVIHMEVTWTAHYRFVDAP